MSDVLDVVAFDIETTGFGAADEVTVIGFELDLGVRVFVQTGGRADVDPAHGREPGPGDADVATGTRSAGESDGDAVGAQRSGSGSSADVGERAEWLAAQVRERVAEHVVVSVHDGEAELFAAVADFAAERLCDEEMLLVAYNGETWRGGFDLPFLRTRFAAQSVAWPFQDVPYADILPVIRRYFNTTTTTTTTTTGDAESEPESQSESEAESQSDLDTAYAVLCDGGLGGCDPFQESGEAVTAYEEGRFVELVTHNVVDILQTAALARLAQRYCSKSDFKLKSLTPTIDARD